MPKGEVIMEKSMTVNVAAFELEEINPEELEELKKLSFSLAKGDCGFGCNCD